MAITSTPTDGNFTHVIVEDSVGSSTGALDLFDGACTVYGMHLDNSAHAAVVYIKIYNARTVDPSTDVPAAQFMVTANNVVVLTIPSGWVFSSGLSIRAVTGSGDTDTTNPASSVSFQVIGV